MSLLLRRIVLAASLSLPLSLGLSSIATASALPPKVEQALTANKLSRDSLAVALIPVTGTGQPIFFNADKSLNPASTMKLVTTYAALELLGPTYQWRTDFYTDGTLNNGVLNGNLYFKGGGDPKLNMEKLWLLMRDLRANGVREVTGDLVLDGSYFKMPNLPAFNDDGGDRYRPYLVSPDSLLVNLKALRFIIRNDNGTIHVVAEPPIATLDIVNNVKSLPAVAQCPGWPEVAIVPSESNGVTRVTVSGKLPVGCNMQSYLALLDHPEYAAGAVRAIWAELGGTIRGTDRLGTVPAGARLLARAGSPEVVEVIRDVNKYSNNTMARQLFLSIGARHRTAQDLDDGQAANRVIHNWFEKKGINSQQLVMENGSGLSRAERISAREMGEMLRSAWNSPFAAELISSLPIAATDGTLRNRFRNTPLVGNAHLKTGTLNNVRALAGFTRDKNGNIWAVAVLLNDPRPWGGAAVLDQVLLSVYNQQL